MKSMKLFAGLSRSSQLLLVAATATASALILIPLLLRYASGPLGLKSLMVASPAGGHAVATSVCIEPADLPCNNYDYIAGLMAPAAAAPSLSATRVSWLSSSANAAVTAAAATAATREAAAADNNTAAATALHQKPVPGQVTELYQWYHHLQGSIHLTAATPAFHCLANTFLQGPPDRSVFSQFGEDGVIEAIQACIKTTDKFYVEFGTQNGSVCTTRFLREAKNWTGLLMDGGFENSTINLHREMVYAENIVSLFQKYHVPHPSFDMLTVDIDLNTAHLLRAVLAGGYRPRMMVVEYNRNFAPSDSYITAYAPDERWAGNCYFSGSGLALERIARAFGYSLVALDLAGVNLYFVRDDILGMPFPHSFADLTRDLGTRAWKSVHKDCKQTLWMYVEDSSQLAGISWMSHLFPVQLSHKNSELVLSAQQRQQLRQDWMFRGKSVANHAAAANVSYGIKSAKQQAAAAHFPAPALHKVRTFYEIRLTSELAVLPCGNPSNSSNSSTASAVAVRGQPQPAQQSLQALATDGAKQLQDDVTGLDSHRRQRHACRVRWLQHLKTANIPC